jgi:hypothetical protein
VMDGRVDHRLYFASALPGVPPLIGLANASAIAGVYNNGNRRFFEPFLIDRYGDRGDNHGQQLNGGGDTTPGNGGISDPLWNGRADPTWAPDGRNVVYWQALVTAPACGPANPTVPTCPTSTEPGGRRTRLMIANLTSRTPVSIAQPTPIPDEIPWGIEYHAGDPLPTRPHLPGGTYTLNGKVFGSASVVITENPAKTAIDSVQVTYTNYTDDGINVINGTQSATRSPANWHSNLALSGCHTGSQVTSEPGGFTMSGTTRTGTLTTTLDGISYTSPLSNT